MLHWLKACAVIALLACSLVGSAVRAEDNPYKKAEVGDWISFKSSTKMAALEGAATVMDTKQTVTAKTEKEVTLKMEVIMNGATVSTTETKIQLDKPYDPVDPRDPDVTIEKIGEGSEDLTVAGKVYKCKWYQVKSKINKGGQKIESEAKSWICPDVPLGGLVKSEMNISSMNMKTTIELTGAGKK